MISQGITTKYIRTMESQNMINHIAFIMDGNRRWAKQHALPTFTGHARGYKRIEPLVTYAKDHGIKYLTFWAFSTENWKRDQQEVLYLLQLFRRTFRGGYIDKLIKQGGRVVVLGDITPFPEDIRKNIERVVEESKDNSDIIINIGLNYGGRSEILHAIQSIIAEGKSDITERDFSRLLYTHDQPDPDLIIRTGGEQRLSGFLPWQAVYSELYFPNILWPDFTEHELEKAIDEFIHRERRFGK